MAKTRASQRTVNIYAAKTHLSDLVAAVERTGESVVICRDGEPLVEIRRLQPKNPLRIDPLLAKTKILEDPMAPVSLDDWPEDAR